jgi:simple sugar transport system permease protein
MNAEKLRESLLSVTLAVGATVVGVLLSMIIIQVTGHDARAAARALWDGAFGTRQQVYLTAARMPALVLVALGWIVAFRSRKVNLGLEGQVIIGGVIATLVAVEGPSLPAVAALALCCVVAMLAAALYAAIAALLWAKRGVNEIVSTLMLTFIARQILEWVVRGPMQNPGKASFQSKPIPAAFHWPQLAKGTPFSADAILALVAVAVIVFVINRTTFGFKLRLTGENDECSRHAGVPTVRIVVLGFLLSGALAGLAGAGLLLGGERHVLTSGFTGNVGFTGIVVALVARNSPIGSIPAALLFAALATGGGVMQARADVPSEIVFITQGVIVVLVACSGLVVRALHARRVDVDHSGPPPASQGLVSVADAT